MTKNNNHLYLFAAISFAAILLIIVFSPKASNDISPNYLSASTVGYSSTVLE